MAAVVLAYGTVAAVLPVPPAQAAPVPSGFQEQIVFAGLSSPTNIEFAPDGRIFVAEKAGVIKVFDNLADTTATVFADLRPAVHNFADRGLLGLALAPGFPGNPWVYVLYTYDAPPGGTAPVYNDACPVDGACIVTGRLSRLQASGNVMTGTEQVLLTDWCQQFSSHSIGDLAFAPDGALYVTGGDGASFNVVDHGQLNGGSNPCSDPPSEGGALRSQDVRSTVDPTSLDGALLRLDPATGAAMAGNPNIASADANTRRIVGYGLRNPYRMTIRPGTSEAWIADTGWTTWEEVNRAPSPAGEVVNFGWPCYEGSPRQSGYDNANIPLCESLYTGTAPIAPFKAWNHASKVVTGETCPTGSSSSTGVAFYPGTGPYPADYRGALFFADYSRDCIWVMKPATPGGLPDAAATATFVAGAANPVDLAIGPGAELYYVDLGGSVRRIRYFPGNQPPTAAITTDATSGPTPLLVRFDGRASTDPDAADQGRLTYAWDFTNDGTTDSTAPNPTFTYSTQGRHTARLTVTDTLGATGTETVEVLAGLGAPTAIIETPSAGTTWATGQTISFSGRATDPEDGTLAPSRLTWQVVLQHCSIINSTNCHAHVQQEITGATGSFVAPDHEYPSYLELRLIATDSDGTTNAQTVRLDPRTVNVTFAASQPGLNLTVGSFSAAAPYTLTMIQGSTHTVSASSPQSVGATSYTFTGWSDGGARTHEIVAPTAPTTLTATYAAATTINLALNKPATSSTPCGASEGPAKAVNGTVTGGSTDKWCSGVSGSKWLQVDLGAVHDLSSIVVSHAGAGGEPDVWNTRDFVLDVSTDGTTWTPVATVTGNTANVTTHPVAVSGRYVRLRITAPVSTGSAVARIYELVVNGSSVGAPPPPPPPPPPVPTNLALNKPATSSTPCATAEGPAKAVNGSVTGGSTDKWCSAVADKWLRVDLGATYNVTTVVVHHAGAGDESSALNTRDFAIDVSQDGTIWTTAANVTANTADVTTHAFSATGRHVRLRVLTATSTGDAAARIYELEVSGTPGTPPPPVNLALNKAATSSTPCTADEGPAKAVNGTVTGGLTDRWCSNVADRWLQVDLGASHDVTAVTIRHAGAGGEAATLNTRDFAIDVSTNGTTWTTAASITANTANVTSHPVTGTGRYVRLRVLTPTSSGDPAARIYELEVNGTPAAPPPLTNLALNKPATSSDSCAATEGPAKAVNGSVADKWCSGAADKWLQVDLGAAYALSTVVIRHAGAGDEPGSWNTRDFAIDVSTNGTTWTTAVNVTGNTADVTTHPVTGTFRYVRLRVITATSTSESVARIYEFEVNGTS